MKPTDQQPTTDGQPTPEQQEAQRQATEMQRELSKQAAKGATKEFIKSSVAREMNRAVSQMLPDEVNRLRWSGLKAIPVIGSLVDWSDRIFQLRRIFGKT